MNKVYNDNTISATLATKVSERTAITTLQSRLALILAFTKKFTTDLIKPKAVIEVPMVTAGPATKTDTTNWETAGDSTITNVEVTPVQLSQSFHALNAELQNGTLLENLFIKNQNILADAIVDVVLAPLTVGNYGAATFTGQPAAFGLSNAAELLTAIKAGTKRSLILDTDYFSKLIPGLVVDGNFTIPGFNGGVLENTRFNGAEASVRGFACSPECLAVGAGLPIDPPNTSGSGFNSTGTITIPGVGLTVALYSWSEPRYRRTWFSYDLVIGSKAADTSALKLIKSAA
jgi:hypothetical protein